MFQSERFLGRLAKLRKDHRTADHDRQIELVHEAFLGLLPQLPASMAEELFDAFSEQIVARSSGSAFFDDAAYLADVADVIAGEYDARNDPIVAEDWKLLGEIVNDYALDLDMDSVTYIMALVVDHGGVR